jgi:hypothetical protein
MTLEESMFAREATRNAFSPPPKRRWWNVFTPEPKGISRFGSTFWEGEASGAALLQTTYGSFDSEGILPTFASATNQAYNSNAIVFGAILARLALFSEATFKFQKYKDKSLFGTTALSAIESPWPNGTTGELLARMIQDVDLAGNCYIWNAGEQLVRLRPDQVTIVSHEETDQLGRTYRKVLGYWWDPRGLPGLPRSDSAQYFDVDEISHWCCDVLTEILTASGWKTYDQLTTNDEVLTLNHETGMSEWQPVLEVLVFPAKQREMVLMEGREFSSLSTLNHRWATEYKNSRAGTYGRRWVTSETIGAGDRIPGAAMSADLAIEAKWNDALVEIVAWFWTEGRYKSGSKPGSKGRGISIGQSHVKNLDNIVRIRSALTSLFGDSVTKMSKKGPRSDSACCWRESQDGDITIFSLSANASDVITEHAPNKIVTTKFIRSLTLSQLDLFIKVSLLADNNGKNKLAQKNKCMAEQFVLACLLAGYAVSIREGSIKKNSFKDGYRMWIVNILKKHHVYPQETSRPGSVFRKERVMHDGIVWCPRTKNQTWLARRNGSVYFTGNSPIPDPQANFRGMSWLTPVVREIMADTAMTEYKIKYLNNAASPNMVIKYPEMMEPDQIDRLRERLQARYGGMSNAFKTLILDQGADYSVVGNSFEQMNFSTVQAAGENRILIASGVPGIVVGSKEGLSAATYSNYQQAMRRFSDITMRPLWRSVSACLEKLVVVPGGARLWFDVQDIAALRQGEQERAKTMLIKAQACNALTVSGYDRDSIYAAVDADDLTLLVATTLVPRMLIEDPRIAHAEPQVQFPLDTVPPGDVPRNPDGSPASVATTAAYANATATKPVTTQTTTDNGVVKGKPGLPKPGPTK